MRTYSILGLGAAILALGGEGLAAQHAHHGAPASAPAAPGWGFSVMGQVFPVLTAGEPFDPDAWLHDRETYLTQPALMLDLAGPRRRLAVRVTWDLEQLTQPDGEYTFGGWGEGFIDKRHPHTLLHEAMVSWNAWAQEGGGLSLSAGKGFAPYGTEDPMGRPVLKYPTNHHLSQILERWAVIGAFAHPAGWSLEASVFGGEEPRDAYDLSNIESFGDSWSARFVHRLGGNGDRKPWEASLSYARVVEDHGSEREVTRLANAYGRYESGALYALVEGSRSWPVGEEGYWALLAETRLTAGRHVPYARVEWSTRPEMHRLGSPETEGYYRYEHGGHADGASRWLILSLGYAVEGGGGLLTSNPFVEVQYHRVSASRGAVDPMALFGRRGLWSVSTGFRLFLGGGSMRMGSYGVLDPMAPGRAAPAPADHGS